jgi:organic radical activating enzyme
MQPLYPVLEIFQSIQGEGANAGMFCNFVRLAGCPNKCSFCDTEVNGPFTALSPDEIVSKLQAQMPVVITGGEPMIHDLHPLQEAIPSSCPMFLETSASIKPQGLTSMDLFSWISVSPKKGHPVHDLRANEVKWLVPEWSLEEIQWHLADLHFLQPVNYITALNRANVRQCLDMLANAPRAEGMSIRLSIQLHKILGVK